MGRVYHGLASALLTATLSAQPLPLGKVPEGKNFLVFLSHHDDHTWDWGFGGFIARLVDSGWTGSYVRTTNDEKDGREWGPNDQINLRGSRAAARRLGMKEVISLNWRNDHMSSIPLRELRAQFILLIRKHRPDIVMAWNPWGHYDRNPDHRRVGRAIGEAVWMAGLANVHPEHQAAGLLPFRVPYVYYTQRSDYGQGHRPNVAIEFNEQQLRRKEEAFWAHKNVYNSPGLARSIREKLAARGMHIPELDGLSDEQAIEKLRKWSMDHASRRAGQRAGVRYAELFYFIDEWDHLPGLRDYLRENVRAK